MLDKVRDVRTPIPFEERPMKNTDRKLSRRNFLIGLGAGGASATVALVSKDTKSDAGHSAKSETGKGYRLTEHVQNYYRTTKV
jgi:hypothetical protein